jgi:hypothetical protein
MRYRDELQVVFSPDPLTSNAPKKRQDPDPTRVELSYCPKGKEQCSQRVAPLTAVKEFILGMLRDQLIGKIPRPGTVKQFLLSISNGWDLAYSLQEEIRLLGFNGMTTVILNQPDSQLSLKARCMLVGSIVNHGASPLSPRRKAKASQKDSQESKGHQARVDVDFTLTAPESRRSEQPNPDMNIVVNKVYGFENDDDDYEADPPGSRDVYLSETQMQELVYKTVKMASQSASSGTEEVKGPSVLGQGLWSHAVGILAGRVF